MNRGEKFQVRFSLNVIGWELMRQLKIIIIITKTKQNPSTTHKNSKQTNKTDSDKPQIISGNTELFGLCNFAGFLKLVSDAGPCQE